MITDARLKEIKVSHGDAKYGYCKVDSKMYTADVGDLLVERDELLDIRPSLMSKIDNLQKQCDEYRCEIERLSEEQLKEVQVIAQERDDLSEVNHDLEKKVEKLEKDLNSLIA